MSTYFGEERLIPVGSPLYSKILPDGTRKEFFCGLYIQHSSPMYRWKVYIGDIVAISMADHSKNKDGCLSQQDIEDWHPDHLKKKSPHWKIGLVLAMAQIVDPHNKNITSTTSMTNINYECHVEWLEKALEIPEFLKNKKLSQSYRPYTKETVKFKLPHVLLRSHRHASISPANILPVQITMLTDADFKDGVLWDPLQRPEDRFSFKMHCPKFISTQQVPNDDDGTSTTVTTFQPDPCMDSWPELNHYSFVKKTSSKTIPRPLQQAWAKWRPIQEDDDLLVALMKGYEMSCGGKIQEYRNFKNRQVEEQKRIAEEEHELQLQAQAAKRPTKRDTTVAPHTNKNSKRSAEPSNGDKLNNTNKRVRVSINGNTPVAGPTKSKGGISSHVKSILKTAIDSVTNKKVQQKPNKKKEAAPTNKASSGVKPKTKTTTMTTNSTTTTPVRSRGESTPSTKSLSSGSGTPSSPSSSSFFIHKLPNLNLSKKQLAMNVSAMPGERPIHQGLYQGERYDFYERVIITVDREAQPRVIVVGQVVALVKEDEGLGTKALEPLHCPWGVAQILALYRSIDRGDWMLQLRWFLRYVEAPESVQNQLGRKKYFDLSQGLLETMDVGVSLIQAILPVHVDIATTARGKLLKQLPTRMDYNEIPVLYFQCRYLQDDDGSIGLRNDWDGFSPEARVVRGPLARAVACMNLNNRLKSKYEQAIRNRPSEVEEDEEDDDDDDDGSGESSVEKDSLESLLVEPLSEKPIFEKWGAKFHDGLRIFVDRRSLHNSFSPQTAQWTVKVGYVVPVAYEMDGATAKPRKNASKRWFPFICSWSPAQIVSLYEDGSGTWKMQIRWFHRFEDLIDEQKEGLGIWNKPHVVFETDFYADVDVACCLPGRVILSSSNCDSWEVAPSNISGLPVIPRFCSHICLDEDVDESADWTNYDVLLSSYPRPLSRGMLMNPRNRKNKDWILMLSRRYKKSLSFRGSDPEDLLFKRWEGQGPFLPSSHVHVVDFSSDQVTAKVGSGVWHAQELEGSNRVNFSQTLSIRIPIDYIAMPSKAIRKTKFLTSTVTVGDVVAFHAPDAGERTDHIMMKNLKYPWFPFRVSWCYGQVMAIHYENSGESIRPPLVEMRRFYRPSEIPLTLRAFTPPTEDAEREEVFESDTFISSIPASLILGPCELFLGKHERSCSGLARRQLQPLLSCRSRFFYYSCHGRFQPIYATGLSPEAWWKNLFSRGISLSTFLGQYRDLQHLMASACSESKDTLDVRDLLGGTTAAHLGGRRQVQTSGLSPLKFFAEATILPKWDDVIDADVHFNRCDRALTSWEIHIGSMVVIRNDSMVAAEGVLTFPFRVPWIPCQIIAIYSTGSADVEALRFEVAVMKLSATSGDANAFDVPTIDASEGITTSTVQSSELLGPLVLIPRESQASLDWGEVPKTMPFVAVNGSKLSLREMKEFVTASTSHITAAVIEVLDSLSQGSALDDAQVLARLPEQERTSAKICSNPVFVDVSHQRVFYEDCWLVPQVERFERWLSSKTRVEDWCVRTGDVVLIHCDGPKKYPLKCNWGVAEVIAIWKDYENRDQLEKDVHGSEKTSKAMLKAEIRWFYERSDVAGVSGVESGSESNEVFETDDTVVLDDLTTILAPACLYSNPDDDLLDSRKFLNLPIQTFLCRRFWSTNRRSLIPCGDLAGRESRARLYSQVIPSSFPTKASRSDDVLGKFNSVADATRISERPGWTDAVREVIAKLSLKETSKGAYDRGETLIGRENEMTQLLSFFRAAIRGLPGPGGVRSSIFLAGAPGVGKTACIRSAIARLHSEQARGELPAFTFIPLNGMEMRHPFEAYVKLWEALTGEKHVGSHEKACQRLEYHFTNPKSLASDDDRSTTVVLLDEIDYLVTEKQSVLYNFFDWPKRAASVPGGRRLVVVGISNTLNLAEQLMPSVQSRVGSERIVFRAYGVTEATAILQKKIAEASPDYKIFEKDAILFAAKKTAAMSGDIRKAFQICRGAAELLLQRADEAEKENVTNGEAFQGAVRISDVQKASRESFDSALVAAVSFSTPFQALLLVSLASLCRSTGREVGGFDITDIMTKMDALSGSCGDPEYAPPPAFAETLQLLSRLSETNLIKVCTASSSSVSFRSLGGGGGGAWPMTTLAVDEHTITRGLKGTPHQKLAERCLPSQY